MVRFAPTWTAQQPATPLPTAIRRLAGPGRPLQIADLAILLELADLAWRRAAYPGHATLARLTGWPRNTIRRAIERAAAAGIMTAGAARPGEARDYTLHVPDPAQAGQPSPHYPAQPGQPPLPNGGRYPALSGQGTLTTDEAVHTESLRQRRTEHVENPDPDLEAAITGAIAIIQGADPREDPDRLRAQLRAANVDRPALATAVEQYRRRAASVRRPAAYIIRVAQAAAAAAAQRKAG